MRGATNVEPAPVTVVELGGLQAPGVVPPGLLPFGLVLNQPACQATTTMRRTTITTAIAAYVPVRLEPDFRMILSSVGLGVLISGSLPLLPLWLCVAGRAPVVPTVARSGPRSFRTAERNRGYIRSAHRI